jgi:hypothetical protein
MVFNATFNNISVISRRSVLFVKETGVPVETYRPAAIQWQTLSHMLYRVHLAWAGFELTKLVVIGTDYIGSCKSTYHTITTPTPSSLYIKHKGYKVYYHHAYNLQTMVSFLLKVLTITDSSC